MKDEIAIGGLAGLMMAAVGWDAQRFVDPHTVSDFPSWRMAFVVPLVFGAMVWLLARRRKADNAASFVTAVAPAVVAASCVYGAMMAFVTWQRWTEPPVWLFGMVFVTSTVTMIAEGTLVALTIAAILFRKNRVAI